MPGQSILVINAAGAETRVALVESGTIHEFYLERKREKGIVGNIYKGRVVRVLPGMQAAFVDIGLDKAAFLYVGDVYGDPDFSEEFELTEGEHAPSLNEVPTEEEAEQQEARARAAAESGPPQLLGAEPPPVNGERPAGSAAPAAPFENAAPAAPVENAGPAAPADIATGSGDALDVPGTPPPADEPTVDAAADGLTPIPLTHAIGMEAVPTPPPLLVPAMPEGTPPAVDSETALAAEAAARPAEVAAGSAEAAAGSVEVLAGSSEGSATAAVAEQAPAGGQFQVRREEAPREAREKTRRGREGREGGREGREAGREGREAGREGREAGREGREGGREGREGREGGREGREGGREGRERDRKEHRHANGREERRDKAPKNIQDLLKEGQEVIVQVAKDPIGTKGARITSHISLPGRHMVFMPTVDHIGISRRIEKESERRRLREVVDRMRPEGTGYIVRTVAENVEAPKLEADIRFLIQVWNEIIRTKDKVGAPALLHPDLDLILRATRDLFTADVGKLVIDDRDEHDRILRFVKEQAPHLESQIELYRGDEPIFDAYGIEQELKRASQRKVWLKSGGYIIIDQAEALTAVDVNSGRYVGKKNLEETITKINIEAAKEIVYQLRLRNIGGIIIIDFIDMDKPQNRDKVFKALQEALGRDKAKTNVLKISELGLVEMTRKRVRESVTRMMNEPCTYCEGKGHVKSKVTVAYEIFREIRRDAPTFPDPVLAVNCHPEVARILVGEERDELRYLMDRFNKTIQVKAQNGYHAEQFDIFGRHDRGGEKEEPRRGRGRGGGRGAGPDRGDGSEAPPPPAPAPAEPAEAAPGAKGR